MLVVFTGVDAGVGTDGLVVFTLIGIGRRGRTTRAIVTVFVVFTGTIARPAMVFVGTGVDTGVGADPLIFFAFIWIGR